MNHYLMNAPDVQSMVDEATFDFTMGESEKAIITLNKASRIDPDSFAVWHALAEIYFDCNNLKAALDAGLKAAAINKEDTHIHTTLSRIYMESGDKESAEKHGARARILGWKEDLKEK